MRCQVRNPAPTHSPFPAAPTTRDANRRRPADCDRSPSFRVRSWRKFGQAILRISPILSNTSNMERSESKSTRSKPWSIRDMSRPWGRRPQRTARPWCHRMYAVVYPETAAAERPRAAGTDVLRDLQAQREIVVTSDGKTVAFLARRYTRQLS